MQSSPKPPEKLALAPSAWETLPIPPVKTWAAPTAAFTCLCASSSRAQRPGLLSFRPGDPDLYLRRGRFGGVPLSCSSALPESVAVSCLPAGVGAPPPQLFAPRTRPDAPRPALDSASGVLRPLPIRGGRQAIGSHTCSARGAELVGLWPRCLGSPVHPIGSRKGFCSNLYPGCQWDYSSRVWSNLQGSLRPAGAERQVFSRSPVPESILATNRSPGCILSCPRAGAGETPTSAEWALGVGSGGRPPLHTPLRQEAGDRGQLALLKALTLIRVLTKTLRCPPLSNSSAIQKPSQLGLFLSGDSGALCFQLWSLVSLYTERGD